MKNSGVEVLKEFEFYQKAFDVSPIPQAFIDLKTKKWLRVNSAFLKMFGYSEEEFLKKSIRDITHPDDLNISSEASDRMLSGEIESFQTEKKYIHASGKVLYGIISVAVIKDKFDKPRYSVSQLQDITEITLANKALEDKKSQLKLVIDTVYDGFWDWDIKNDYEYMSPRFWEILGFKPEEKRHHPSEWQQLIFEEDLKEVLILFGEHVRTKGKALFHKEVRYYHKKGHVVWVLCKGKVVDWNDKGEPLRMVGSHTDITVLKKSQEQLVYGSKMIALGEMAGGIAHEINNPMSVISSHAYYLLERLKLKDFDMKKCEESLNIISSTVDRVSHITEGLLSFAKGEVRSDGDEVYQLKDLIKQTLSFCEEKFSKNNIKLQIHLDDNTSKQVNMGVEFTQVLLNLLNNSFYSVKELEGERIIKVDVQREENSFLVFVEDNGSGVSEDIENKIMQPFFTTKPVSDGTGLGLSISKGLLEMYGGKLEFIQSDVGARFKICVPFAKKKLEVYTNVKL